MKAFQGVAHYPEYWPRERYRTDLDQMKEIGLSVIRIGEFAWSSLEPQEGQFTTDWLSEFVGLARERGIGIVMCTPSACPPQWLTTRYPETRLLRGDGRPFNSYLRKHYCPSSPRYHELVRRVNAATAAAVAPYDNVLAWQIDNELGPHEVYRCFCDVCRERFVQWLQGRYGTLDELNRAWRTAYWSQQITGWDQLELPTTRSEPSMSLDFARFYHDSVVGFFEMQKQHLRSCGVQTPISTNFMGPVYEGLDYWQFAGHVDRVFYDNYVHSMNVPSVCLGLDIFRNLRQDFFYLSETNTTADQVGDARQSELRLWLYQSLARGSRGSVYFQWRTLLSGGEQTHPSMLTHEGRPTAAVAQAKAAAAELAGLAAHVDAMGLPRPKVALVLDWQAILASVTPTEFLAPGITEIQKHLMAIYTHFIRRGVTVDVVPPGRDLSPYKLAVLGGLCTVLDSPEMIECVKKFVSAGGVAVATATVASKDAFNNYYPQPQPDGLAEVFGLSIGESRQVSPGGTGVWDRITPAPTIQLASTPGRSFETGGWTEELRTSTARPLGTYAGGVFAGKPAVTINDFSRGKGIYVGTVAEADLLGPVLEQACELADVKGRELPEDVQYIDCSPYHFFLNSASQPRTVHAAPAGEVLVGRCQNGQVQLEPYGVCWIKS